MSTEQQTAQLTPAEQIESEQGAIDEIIAAIEQAYDALEFAPGEEPNWDKFSEVFDPAAVMAFRVFPSDDHVSVLSVYDYAREQMRNNLGDQGYSETPGARNIRMLGDAAMVWQEFTMNFASGPVAAVDVFSLIRRNGRWFVVSVVGDAQSSDAITIDV